MFVRYTKLRGLVGDRYIRLRGLGHRCTSNLRDPAKIGDIPTHRRKKRLRLGQKSLPILDPSPVHIRFPPRAY